MEQQLQQGQTVAEHRSEHLPELEQLRYSNRTNLCGAQTQQARLALLRPAFLFFLIFLRYPPFSFSGCTARVGWAWPTAVCELVTARLDEASRWALPPPPPPPPPLLLLLLLLLLHARSGMCAGVSRGWSKQRDDCGFASHLFIRRICNACSLHCIHMTHWRGIADEMWVLMRCFCSPVHRNRLRRLQTD